MERVASCRSVEELLRALRDLLARLNEDRSPLEGNGLEHVRDLVSLGLTHLRSEAVQVAVANVIIAIDSRIPDFTRRDKPRHEQCPGWLAQAIQAHSRSVAVTDAAIRLLIGSLVHGGYSKQELRLLLDIVPALPAHWPDVLDALCGICVGENHLSNSGVRTSTTDDGGFMDDQLRTQFVDFLALVAASDPGNAENAESALRIFTSIIPAEDGPALDRYCEAIMRRDLMRNIFRADMEGRGYLQASKSDGAVRLFHRISQLVLYMDWRPGPEHARLDPQRRACVCTALALWARDPADRHARRGRPEICRLPLELLCHVLGLAVAIDGRRLAEADSVIEGLVLCSRRGLSLTRHVSLTFALDSALADQLFIDPDSAAPVRRVDSVLDDLRCCVDNMAVQYWTIVGQSKQLKKMRYLRKTMQRHRPHVDTLHADLWVVRAICDISGEACVGHVAPANKLVASGILPWLVAVSDAHPASLEVQNYVSRTLKNLAFRADDDGREALLGGNAVECALATAGRFPDDAEGAHLHVERLISILTKLPAGVDRCVAAGAIEFLAKRAGETVAHSLAVLCQSVEGATRAIGCGVVKWLATCEELQSGRWRILGPAPDTVAAAQTIASIARHGGVYLATVLAEGGPDTIVEHLGTTHDDQRTDCLCALAEFEDGCRRIVELDALRKILVSDFPAVIPTTKLIALLAKHGHIDYLRQSGALAWLAATPTSDETKRQHIAAALAEVAANGGGE